MRQGKEWDIEMEGERVESGREREKSRRERRVGGRRKDIKVGVSKGFHHTSEFSNPSFSWSLVFQFHKISPLLPVFQQTAFS